MICAYTQEEFDNAKPSDKLNLKCEYCGKIFSVEKRQIKFELSHDRGRCKYCSVECSNKAHNTKVKVKCEYCDKDLEITRKEYNKSKTKHFFCNHSCSAIYNNSQRNVSRETKQRVNVSLPTIKHRSLKVRICKVCGKEYTLSKEKGTTKSFCSKECSEKYHSQPQLYMSDETREKLKQAGLRSAQVQSETRRSKNEIYFCQLCEGYFNDVKHNEAMFNGWDADVILPNERYAILWNGKWHYNKITEKHSVLQVQNRDRIKINEIVKCGYKPYIIKDLGKHNKAFVEEEFEKFKKFLKKSC